MVKRESQTYIHALKNRMSLGPIDRLQMYSGLICKTFYSIDPTEGLSEILYTGEANGKDPNFPKTATPTPSLIESNSGSYPIH